MMKRIVVLLLIITGLYIVFYQSFQFNGFAFGGSKDGRAELSKTIDSIEINVGSVRTTIIPEDRNDVEAVLTGKGSLTVKKTGNRLLVETKKEMFNWFSFSGKRQLKVYIPKDFNRNMNIQIGSGSLDFSGKSMKLNKLSLDIGSGNVNLDQLEVDEFTHDGSSGNVEIDTLTTKTGTFDLSSGNLDIKHYTGSLNADVSSGKFSVQMDKLNDSIDIDLSSGNVNLDLPDNADFTLNGNVSSGNISSEFPLTTTNSDKKSLKGTHGSGKHKIDISVSSGTVTIN
ncbi:LiaG family protein [Neobacillus vireti]|uniref:LiaG family protein n=1 Tax=Neobacillus vireti TaxID=220686 RepID=UPI002FFE7B15